MELGCVADARPLTESYPALPGQCLVARGSRAKLAIQQKDDNARDRLVADLRGLTFDADLADFGDPVVTTGYQVCVFATRSAGSTLRSVVAPESVPAGAGWNATASGFKYRSASGGIRSLAVDVGARSGKARLRLKGKGEQLGLPDRVGFNAGVDVPIVVEVRSDSGACWAAQFDSTKRSRDNLRARD